MKICPNCKRDIEDDSVYCGYCDAKFPYIPEEEKEKGNTGEAAGAEDNAAAEAAPAVRRCENCGEQLEENFDTCWKCGSVKARDAEGPAADGADGAAAPLLAVWALDKRVEVYRDRVLIVPSGAPGVSGETAYVPPCEIPIKDIVSIEFTNAEGAVAGCMAVNYTAAPPDDTADVVSRSESALFDAGADQEMARALELIKRCRADLDAQAGDGER